MAGSPIKKARHIAKLREIGLDVILEDVAAGMLYRAIAEKHGVSQSAVSEFLYLDENRPHLAAARKAGARAHVEIALIDAEAEQDPRMAGLLKLRADMRLHLARADDSETWSEKKNVAVSGELNVQSLHLLAVSKRSGVLPGRAIPEAVVTALEETTEPLALAAPAEQEEETDAEPVQE